MYIIYDHFSGVEAIELLEVFHWNNRQIGLITIQKWLD